MVHGVRVSERHRTRAAHGGETHEDEPTLVDWLLARYPEIKNVGDDPALRPGIVHRLDKATSGVMLVAKTQASFEHLKKIFQEHRMQKTYVALVRGVPKESHGVIDAPIGIKNGTLKRSIHSSKMAKSAVTEYSVVKIFDKGDNGSEQYALLKVNPKTGRTHQIRVHLASIGHPIVGDMLYGRKPVRGKTARSASAAMASAEAARRTEAAPRLMLHAASIAFDGDGVNRFEFEAPLPEGFIT